MQNEKKLQLQVLVDSRYTHIEINKQLVKTKLADILFEVFNADSTKNREVTRFSPLKIKINGHKEQINIVVIDLNSTDMFLEHDWLVKHNLEVNWEKDIIQFMRYLRICKTKHQNIMFKIRRA